MMDFCGGRLNRSSACRFIQGENGQMTIELMVALPVLIAVALIAVNAMTFMNACAAFDRQARDAIRVCASSPTYGVGTSAAAADIEAVLDAAFPEDFLAVSVASAGRSPGYVRYTATLRFTPTLFGRAFSGSVFGVTMMPIEHETSLVLDPYKPGAAL